MKRLLKGYLAGFISAAVILTTANVFASDIQKTIEVVLNKVNVSINGNIIGKSGEDYALDNGQKMPYSIVYKGTTYLPIRKVAELVGKDVSWNGETNTVGLNDKGLILDDYSNALYIKGEILTLYTDAKLSDYIPGEDRELISYGKKFEDASFIKMYGKYSNMGNQFVSTEVIFYLVPQFKDEIISDIKHFEVTKYNERLYLGMVELYRFLKEKNMELKMDYINAKEGSVYIENLKE